MTSPAKPYPRPHHPPTCGPWRWSLQHGLWYLRIESTADDDTPYAYEFFDPVTGGTWQVVLDEPVATLPLRN